ncbi:Transport inhibitor response 1-like protein, partial [Cucurbita argyrosperma subsp. sororia]
MSEDEDRSLPSDLAGDAIAESVSKARNCVGCSGDVAGSDSGSVENILHNVLENVLHFLTSRRDRNAASLVCKSWYRVEALTRSELFIGNCYAVSPRRVTSRFNRVRSVMIKGKPRFADFNLMPPNWGAHFSPWVAAMAKSYPWLETVYLKRMSVTDDDLALLADSFPGFKELVLFCCEGFGTSGIAVVASRCMHLRVLDLIESDSALLILRHWRGCTSEAVVHGESEPDYASAFAACKSLVCLSGFKDILPDYLPCIYPVCANLTTLNLSFANITPEQLKPVISHCHKLQTFWALDSICDEGLQAVASTCKELRELRVFPVDVREDGEGPISEVGFQAISEGCRKLQYILYFCQRMTNAAVVAMSQNCQDLVVFRLCIMGRHQPDHQTGEPMDQGFGAIVINCKKLTRLAISGLLTDRAFSYIGKYGKLVRTLSVAFAGNSDLGLKYVLEGCLRLQKLEIRDSPFGDGALRSGLHHYYNMRFLWMSACKLSRQGCQEVARAMPHLVVEVMRNENDDETESSVEVEGMENHVQVLYMYRSLEGPRDDAPKFVDIL